MTHSSLTHALSIVAVATSLVCGAAGSNKIDPPQPTGFPAAASWRHQPQAASFKDGVLSITAGPKSDWYISPMTGAEQYSSDNAPTLLFPVESPDFVFSARLRHDFASQWDAGALVVYVNEHTWIKFCFEKNITGKPMVVSVITRGSSDDVNHFFVEAHEIYLKIAKVNNAYLLYTSSDGREWLLVRSFNLGEGVEYKPEQLRFGFLAQSPQGKEKTVVFDHLVYQRKRIADIFKGE